jgi:uncharacterized protein (TIGR03663 family)
MKNQRAFLLFSQVFAFALAVRLLNLGGIPSDPREAGNAAVSFLLYRTGEYRFFPLLHGPFYYYATAAVFHLAGVSISSARLMPAIFGALVVFLFLPLRKYFTDAGAIAMALLYGASPVFISVSQHAFPDTMMLFFFFASLLFFLSYLEKQRFISLLLASLFLALSATAKEQTFLSLGLLIAIFVCLAFFFPNFTRDVVSKKREYKKLLIALLLFLFVYSLFYSSFLTYLQGLSFAYFGQAYFWFLGITTPRFHEISYQPPPYHLINILRYDAVVFILGIAGGLYCIRKKHRLGIFLFLWGILSFILLTIIPYKTEKLSAHILFPLVPVAGYFLASSIRAIKTRGRKISAVILACLIIGGYYGFTNNELLFHSPHTFHELEEMTGVFENLTEGKKGTKVLIITQPSMVFTQNLVDTSLYMLWGTRHLEDIPIWVRVSSLSDITEKNTAMLVQQFNSPIIGTTNYYDVYLDETLSNMSYIKMQFNTSDVNEKVVAYIHLSTMNETEFERYFPYIVAVPWNEQVQDWLVALQASGKFKGKELQVLIGK